ncbi:MAG: Re/Si-specific NAD(P)(+) transhydrogenase subunit alpha [Chloroflexi bacterium]|nr:Re/Si-specific NAD(P)(+) transhydrogenase subunit alpha [Chloroflexota bacterium]
MKISAPREMAPGERRVALVPETASRFVKNGHEVLVQAGAGIGASFPDAAYVKAGARIVPDAVAAAGAADVYACVGKPGPDSIVALRPGSVVIGLLDVRRDPATLRALAERGVSAFGLEMVPRIARAQRVDVLSSQASVAGYKAALIAANALAKYLPMMVTAAGTTPPAKALVLGAGVAGLQAIATARRLGAVVEAFDVRAAVKEQVASLGGKFLELAPADAEAAGGYARAQTEEEQSRMREALKPHIADADVVITTAAVPGRRAPLLVTADAVRAMRPGSVIVDLAAESGGNCELTKPGETVTVDGVTVHGPLNLPASMANHASQLFSRNIAALLELLIDRERNLKIDFKDEVVDTMCVTHEGKIRHSLGESGR